MERSHLHLIAFYAAVLAAGSFASLARVMADADRPDCMRVISIAVVSGCVALGVLCGLLDYGPSKPTAIPLAFIIGAAGREINDKVLARIASVIIDGAIKTLEAARDATKGKDP